MKNGSVVNLEKNEEPEEKKRRTGERMMILLLAFIVIGSIYLTIRYYWNKENDE